ncbi:MAG: hypothetical protein OSJ62_09940 [Lachnospiraceae bacterium]|nr:hypothetical protein [Lachnospiraceae bacterium]
MEAVEKRRSITDSVVQGSEGVCAVLFLAGILAGTLIFNFYGGHYAEQFLIAMNLSQMGYQQVEIFYPRLIWYILERRGKRFAVLWFGEMTRFQKQIRCLFALYYGLSAGILQSAFCHQKGIFGILEFLILLFPHYFFYGLDWKGIQGFRRKERKGRLAVRILFIFLIGVLAEAYFNTAILQKYYEFVTFVR